MQDNRLDQRSVLKAINGFALAIASISNSEDLFWFAATQVVGRMGFDDCVVYQADTSNQTLRQVAAIGDKNPGDRIIENPLCISFGTGITGTVAQSGAACFISNLSNDSRYIPDLTPALSEICVPFFLLDEIAGVIDCESPLPDAFGEFELETLTTVAAMLSAKLSALERESQIRQHNDALATSEERFNLAMKGASDGIWDWDLTTGNTYFSPRWSGMLGLSSTELTANLGSFLSLVHPEDRERVRDYPGQAFDLEQDSLSSEFRMRHKDGHWVDILSRATVLRKGGVPVRVIGTHVDITAIRAAERALGSSEERYRSLFEKFPIATIESDWTDVKSQLVHSRTTHLDDPLEKVSLDEIRTLFSKVRRRGVNQATLALFEAESEAQLADWIDQRLEHSPNRVTFAAAVAAFWSGKDSYEVEMPIQTCAKREKHVVIRYFLPVESRASWQRILITLEDITERKAAEAKQRKSEAILSAFIRHSTIDMSIKNLDGHFVLVNSPEIAALGSAPNGTEDKNALQLADPETAALMTSYDHKVLQDRQPLRTEITGTFGTEERNYVASKFPIMDVTDSLLGVGTILTDVTEAKQTENRLRSNEARLLEAQKAAKLGWWDVDRAGNLTWSDSAYEIFGLTPSEFSGKIDSFYRCLHPDDRRRVRESAARAWAGDPEPDTTFRVVHKNGDITTVRETAEVERDENGNPIRLKGTVQDVSEQVFADEKLRIAQRMESVGQLTGGIAHDFNNLLAVIQGCAEFLEEDPNVDQQLVAPILRSTQKGADLTHRLLAYARQQPLMPKTINLADLVAGMKDLLIRSLGEHVKVQNIHRPNLWPARADPSQVEDALLNLAINARDAMPDGGQLIIDCSNVILGQGFAAKHREVEPGDYVMLTVTDTGVGMSKEVREHAFEPFYTTKDVGQGSGLGLSMVYGFAQQSGGHVEISSDEGKGTEVRIYLPRDLQIKREPVETIDTEVPRGQGEVVLIIEDDPAVRVLAERTVIQLGYTALVAEDAIQARNIVLAGAKFDLILSDVVLPGGTSGPDFAAELRQTQPHAKIIFMSGYPAESAMNSGDICPDDTLLTKPFSREELARALNATLVDGAD